MEQNEQLIDMTCPECRGPMREVRHDNLVEYRCLVGHNFSVRSLTEAHSETEEKALWAAVVALEESTGLVRAIASQVPPETAASLQRQAEKKVAQAAEIRKIIQNVEPFRWE
jgi:two-component system, chemotaxis family, protein-glutamate methylesterase/glutaminase